MLLDGPQSSSEKEDSAKEPAGGAADLGAAENVNAAEEDPAIAVEEESTAASTGGIRSHRRPERKR